MIEEIALENFKKIEAFKTDLKMINLLVGANNAGKSSILQGIHFSIMAETARRFFRRDRTISERELFYLPASSFVRLRHGVAYTANSGLNSTLTLTNELQTSFSITISKGRNQGNLAIRAEGGDKFRQDVTSFNPFYTMYVPGISGISTNERYVTVPELRQCVARGDANMYMRNILYQISKANKLEQLNEKLHQIFPNVSVDIPYDPDKDLYILVDIISKKDDDTIVRVPLEQSGTGLLHVLQILSYVIYFTPKLLLLDEPDEHLHPDNQARLANVIMEVSEANDVQIIISTHSRYLLAYLEDAAKVIWVKSGKKVDKKIDSPMYNILSDIGALDSFDSFIAGTYRTLVLTEDENTEMLKMLLSKNGVRDYKVFSYKCCKQIDSALMIADFLKTFSPNCKIVLHRDRDFMTNEEVAYYREKIVKHQIIPFITKMSDIESYFVSPQHVAHILNKSVEDVEAWQKELIEQNRTEITVDFTHKRDETKNLPIYMRSDNPLPRPQTTSMLPNPITLDYVKGKYMLRKLNGDMHQKFGLERNLKAESPYLRSPELEQIAREISAPHV